MNNIDYSIMVTADDKLEIQRKQSLDSLAALRWQHETSGLMLEDGIYVTTTRDSQSIIAHTATLVRAGMVTTPMHWKTLQGWVELTPEAMLKADSLIRSHVQACFAAERAVAGQIAASDDPAALDLQAAFLAQIG